LLPGGGTDAAVGDGDDTLAIFRPETVHRTHGKGILRLTGSKHTAKILPWREGGWAGCAPRLRLR
jgi:hypothetical protein